MDSQNIDPSKLSLKERIAFFASKAGAASRPAAAAPKPLSPSRAAASATGTRTRLGASTLGASTACSAVEGSVQRLGVRLPLGSQRPSAPGPPPQDAELAEALAAPGPHPIAAAELAGVISAPALQPMATAAASEAPTPAAAAAAPSPAPIRVTFTIPPSVAALGLGARLHRRSATAEVIVGALDPAGAAALAGVQVGDALLALEGQWAAGDAAEREDAEDALFALLQRAFASQLPLTFSFSRPPA